MRENIRSGEARRPPIRRFDPFDTTGTIGAAREKMSERDPIPPLPTAHDDHPPEAPRRHGRAWRFVTDYSLFLLKNLLGVIFLAGSVVLGPVPGPGGIIL